MGWRRTAAVVAVAGALLATCSRDGDEPRALAGSRIEVVAVWDGSEAERFRAVLDRFGASTGVAVRYTSTEGADIASVLDSRIAAGDPPDLAVLPLPGLLRRYAGEGAITPLDRIVGAAVDERFGPVWRDLGSVDGRLYGLWFKAAHKSLVWYEVGTFERAGVVPVSTLEQLEDLAADLAAAGTTPFAVGAAEGWTLTDWFENLYLRLAGPERYDALAERRLPWTDPSVHQALAAMARLLAPSHLPGGPAGALDTTFPDSVVQVFDPPSQAAMLAGGDFIAGFVAATTPARLGVDADLFLFPEPAGAERAVVVGGGDAVVLLRSSPAADELVRFLATAEAAEVWAALGGFLSPNQDVGLDRYPDERTRRIARSLLQAGDGFRFDLSDQQPAAFGGTAGAGMLAVLQGFLADPGDVAGTARLLEEEAASASAG